MLFGFSSVLMFFVVGLLLLVIALLLARLLRPTGKDAADKYIPYECGEVPEGSAWIRFNIRFYVCALIFIIFDVEIIFLLPWAVVFKSAGSLCLHRRADFHRHPGDRSGLCLEEGRSGLGQTGRCQCDDRSSARVGSRLSASGFEEITMGVLEGKFEDNVFITSWIGFSTGPVPLRRGRSRSGWPAAPSR